MRAIPMHSMCAGGVVQDALKPPPLLALCWGFTNNPRRMGGSSADNREAPEKWLLS